MTLTVQEKRTDVLVVWGSRKKAVESRTEQELSGRRARAVAAAVGGKAAVGGRHGSPGQQCGTLL